MNRVFRWKRGILKRGLCYWMGLVLLIPSLSFGAGEKITVQAEGEEIPIDTEHFPGEEFRSYVLTYADKDRNGWLSKNEIGNVYKFSLDNSGREDTDYDIRGIGYFTELVEFSGTTRKLLSADFTHNTKLRYLQLGKGYYSELDLSKNTALEILDIYGLKLNSIDLGSNSVLSELRLSNCGLTAIDLSKNRDLKKVYLWSNDLKSISFANHPELDTLIVSGNGNLRNLELSGCPNLERLNVSETGLSTIDLTGLPELKEFDSAKAPLLSLDLSKNTELTRLLAPRGMLTSVDLSNNKKLEVLNLEDNELNAIDVSNNPEIYDLSLEGNYLSDLDVSKSYKLVNLNLDYNDFTKIDVSGNLYLQSLSISDNKLTSIDVSNNTQLLLLSVNNNQISSVDLSKNPKITTVNIKNNRFLSIDFSNNKRIESVSLCGNQFFGINLDNSISDNFFLDETPVSSEITLPWAEHQSFDLSKVPGFDCSRISELSGAELSGTILKPFYAEETYGSLQMKATVTYLYDTGKPEAGKMRFLVSFFSDGNVLPESPAPVRTPTPFATENPAVSTEPAVTKNPTVSQEPASTGSPLFTSSPEPVSIPTPERTMAPNESMSPKETQNPSAEENVPAASAVPGGLQGQSTESNPSGGENPGNSGEAIEQTAVPGNPSQTGTASASPEEKIQPSETPAATDGTASEDVYGTVKNFKISSGEFSLTLKWKRMEDVEKYHIYRTTKKNSVYYRIAATKKNRYTDKKVETQKNYFYKVVPVVGGAEKKASVSRTGKAWGLIRPVFQVKKKKTSIGSDYLELRLTKYEGTKIQIYVNLGKGYKKLRLASDSLKKKHSFRIGYQKLKGTIRIKVRVIGRKRKRKRYSVFSKVKTVRLG